MSSFKKKPLNSANAVQRFVREIIAGLTTFLAMVYSVIVVPKMLGDAGFPAESVFIATCLVAGLGSILIGFWANAPMAIGCAISLIRSALAFGLVIGQHVSIPVALGAVFLMGLVFTLISATGIRSCDSPRNLPSSIAHGAGIGIGSFLLLIAANGVGLVVGNQAGLPVKLGDFTSFPVMMSLIGLAFIIGLRKNESERRDFMGHHRNYYRRFNLRSKRHIQWPDLQNANLW